ncbi:MAG: molecular chaperone DnaJ [Cyanobium sp.]
MPQTARAPDAPPQSPTDPSGLLLRGGERRRPAGPRDREPGANRGFGAADGSRPSRRRSGRRRSPALSKGDWGPLGKHPDLEAIVARQRLHLPLSGRLTPNAVNQAWKRCAAEHHPDRGGSHDAMQLVNGARDLLLGRGHP